MHFTTALAAILTLLGLTIYFFGIPAELKRKLERAALKTMGQNKASYMLNDQIDKLPEADQQSVKDLKKGLGKASGGAVRNPLGDLVGEKVDEGTRPMTGR
ncbi:hypothetical protein P152DRAFT_445651 [Eremomyces bilateralis CBS 781.70]|uniref:Uncharacterized protein n=1 Tax=Eremomyces bilateralis CBS 781.70 TaxID=1392243 RepID=A0A6G1GHR5_9PEZI|nr:uncharacterized protein P152DRAFT_445651 [Eremomyces bilateralis CBS 781.70]KAF1817593.1 hypothetical protein P152DRAFT_445651 [Eremomyces bilateralis CBS 781.70]